MITDPQKIIEDFTNEYRAYLDYYRNVKKYKLEVKYGLFHISY
jgi:hypothetical protein